MSLASQQEASRFRPAYLVASERTASIWPAYLFVSLLLAAAACSTETDAAATPAPVPDRAVFELDVYPMLLRDCGFSECHGAEHRFFQVFGPGRSRLDGHPSDPDLAPRERQLTYDRARSMLVAASGGSVFESPLLTKPLELGAGGATHGGVDHFGRNVFQTATDPRFTLLWQWAISVSQPATMSSPTQTAGAPAIGAAGAAGSTTEAAGAGAVTETIPMGAGGSASPTGRSVP